MLGSHLRRHAVAYLALFVALGGTSYAATALPKNSVGTKQIRNNAVTGAKVKNNSLSQNDLSPAARAALKGATGPAGATGTKGEKGDKGDPGSAGSPGLSGYEVTTASDGDITNSLSTLSGTADCPVGKKVLGGGVLHDELGSFTAGPIVEQSGPVTSSPQGWSADVRGQNNDDWSITVYAICANAN
jgi:hypothetical protein